MPPLPTVQRSALEPGPLPKCMPPIPVVSKQSDSVRAFGMELEVRNGKGEVEESKRSGPEQES